MRWILALLAFGAVVAAACDTDSGDDAPRLITYEAQADDAVNVYTIDPESGVIAQLTRNERFTGNPAWSPDRKRIIFVSNFEHEDGSHDLYVMNADGSDVRRIAETEESEWSPKYSPDGERIVYVAQQDDEWAVWLMDADGGNRRALTEGYTFAEFPVWHPDGRLIVYSARGEDREADIFSVDIETGEIATVIATEGADVCPQFSPDGKIMTYGSQGLEVDDVDVYAHDIGSNDTTGTLDQRLTDSPERDDYATWAADGGALVFTSRRDGNTELYLMAPDGSTQRRLTTTPDARENVPDW